MGGGKHMVGSIMSRGRSPQGRSGQEPLWGRFGIGLVARKRVGKLARSRTAASAGRGRSGGPRPADAVVAPANFRHVHPLGFYIAFWGVVCGQWTRKAYPWRSGNNWQSSSCPNLNRRGIWRACAQAYRSRSIWSCAPRALTASCLFDTRLTNHRAPKQVCGRDLVRRVR